MDEDYSDRLGEWRLTETMLGAAMRKPELAQTLIACGFGADDIEHATHRQIWSTLERLHRAGKLADHRVVEAALLDDGLGKDDAAAFIEACMRDSENPESPQLAAYVEGVKRRVAMRRIVRLARQMERRAALRDVVPSEIVTQATSELDAILRGAAVMRAVTGEEGMRLAMQPLTRTDDEADYVPLGIPAIDTECGGAPRGRLTVIAAQRKVGKTTLATRTALGVAPSEPVLWLSLEADQAEMWGLAAQMSAGVRRPFDVSTMTAYQRSAYEKAADLNSRLLLWTEFLIYPTAEEVAALVYAHVRKNKVGLVLVDHIKNIRTTSGRHEEPDRAHIARTIDACAKSCPGTAFVCFSQMKGDKDKGKVIEHDDPVPETQEWARLAAIVATMTRNVSAEAAELRDLTRFRVVLNRATGRQTESWLSYELPTHTLRNTDEGGMPLDEQLTRAADFDDWRDDA